MCKSRYCLIFSLDNGQREGGGGGVNVLLTNIVAVRLMSVLYDEVQMDQ